MAFDELGIYEVLFDPQSKGKIAALVEETLGALIEYDRQHGSELIETLGQYLRHNCHLEETASDLHIHLNTLRYRLKHISAISGVKLHTLEGKFKFDLALKGMRTRSTG